MTSIPAVPKAENRSSESSAEALISGGRRSLTSSWRRYPFSFPISISFCNPSVYLSSSANGLSYLFKALLSLTNASSSTNKLVPTRLRTSIVELQFSIAMLPLVLHQLRWHTPEPCSQLTTGQPCRRKTATSARRLHQPRHCRREAVLQN